MNRSIELAGQAEFHVEGTLDRSGSNDQNPTGSSAASDCAATNGDSTAIRNRQRVFTAFTEKTASAVQKPTSLRMTDPPHSFYDR